MARFSQSVIAGRFAAIQDIMVSYGQVEMVENALRQRMLMGVGRQSARLALLLAESGCGKTTAIRSFMAAVALDASYAGVPRAVLCVSLPVPCTIKSMTSRLLEGLGDPLAHQTSTVDRNSSRIILQLRNQGVRMIVIDEFQHLSEQAKTPHSELTDWLKALLDQAGVPVCCVGLPSAQSVIMSNTQLARRTSRVITMSPFAFDTKEEQVEFRAFLHVYEQALPFAEPSHLSSADLSACMYDASGGLPGRIVQIVAEAAMISMARADGPDCITVPDLAQAYAELPFSEANPFVAPRQVLAVAPAPAIATGPAKAAVPFAPPLNAGAFSPVALTRRVGPRRAKSSP